MDDPCSSLVKDVTGPTAVTMLAAELPDDDNRLLSDQQKNHTAPTNNAESIRAQVDVEVSATGLASSSENLDAEQISLPDSTVMAFLG